MHTTITRTLAGLKAKRTELKVKHEKNFNIYDITANIYGLDDVHHESRKRVMKCLSLKYKMNFKGKVDQANIIRIKKQIVDFKKSSVKTAKAFERTISEILFWEKFTKITKKRFHHSVVLGDHVLDGLIPALIF